MDFGQALHALKNGKKVERTGWNGKGMFIYHVGAGAYPATSPVAKAQWGDELVPYTAYLAIKSVNGTVTPWLASQTDVLADDWQIVDEAEDAPTGIEGKATPLVQIPLDDAKAFRDYFDGINVPDELAEPVKYLHWAITDRDS